ncbi:MAG: KilA-N domain-containing protein [Dysgonamonadaceae bacterium]|nr:KilA-N domain-containing protein [Dysgonamonadaceae bacterium]
MNINRRNLRFAFRFCIAVTPVLVAGKTLFQIFVDSLCAGDVLNVKNAEVTVIRINNEDYICITDMIKAKDGEFFVTDWLRNRSTLEYTGIWEQVYNYHIHTDAIKQRLIPPEPTPQQTLIIYIQQMSVLQDVENRKLLR